MACDKEWIEEINKMLEDPTAEVTLMRSIKEGPPKGEWRTYVRSETKYLVISIGPADIHIENCIRLALGHDVMQLRK